jgi:DNA-binding NarL/FixJ family response regulator
MECSALPHPACLEELKATAIDVDAREAHAGDPAEAWQRFACGRHVLVTTLRHESRQIIVLGDPLFNGLTPRQSRILAMLCAGASLKQIAMEIGKGQPTVSKHVGDAVRRLDLVSHVALVNALGPWAAHGRGRSAPLPDARVSPLRVDGQSFVVVGFSHDEARRPPSLTPAERAVAELVGRGFSNHAIARARHRSPRTIANQLAKTFDKLGVHSRVELVLALGVR